MLSWNKRSQQCGGRDRERWTGLLWRAPSAWGQVISSVLQGLVHPEGWKVDFGMIFNVRLFSWAWRLEMTAVRNDSSSDYGHLGPVVLGKAELPQCLFHGNWAGKEQVLPCWWAGLGAGSVTPGCSEAVGSARERQQSSQLGHPSSASSSFSKLWPVC